MERVYWRMIDYRLWFLRFIFSLPLIFFETSTRIIILCFQTREISSYLHFLSKEMFEYAIQHIYGQRKQRSLLSRTRAKRWPTCPVTCGITQKRLPRLRVQTCFTAQKPLGRGTRRRIAVGDRAEDIDGVSGRWRRIDRHLESNSRSFVHSGSRSSMEARILGIRVKFQFRQPAEIYPGSSFKIIDDDRDTSSRRSNPPGIRLVEDEHRQNNSTHDRQPRAFSPRRAIERRRIPLDLVC